ncbi:MAG: SDR family NAD(P)-dependent oxidoreductase [Desulforhopalus sp.]
MNYSRIFNSIDQQLFAELSADYNPLHMDNVAARRLLFGKQVVHGVHTLCWSIDCFLSEKDADVELITLKVNFLKSVGLDESITLDINDDKPGHAVIIARNESVSVMKVGISYVNRTKNSSLSKFEDALPGTEKCRIIHTSNVTDQKGSLKLYLHGLSFKRLFPHLYAKGNHFQFAWIIATTRLIGMHCPGLHSIYSELDTTFSHDLDCAKNGEIVYTVKSFDQRFNLALLDLKGCGARGTIRAFIRPAPISQISAALSKSHVEKGLFKDQKALIIGGSRGLGEVTVKLLAAGGADIVFTYHQGAEDATQIVDEIRQAGGSAEAILYDVCQNPKSLLANLPANWQPSHLYYYATPFIFGGKKGVFNSSLFEKFCRFYVTGFSDVVTMLNNGNLKKILYPSTVALDEKPSDMCEYVLSKSAGEILCSYIEKNCGISIFRPRIPRMSTDQTANLFSIRSEAPVPVLLEYLKTMNLS